MSKESEIKSVSVIIPVYNEEESVRCVYSQTTEVLLGLGLGYEIIFVDDGSQDSTCAILKGIRDQDSHIRIIKLANNYGQSFAFLAGFEAAVSSVVITMDGDLQNDPRDITQFLSRIDEGFDFITGWRYNRKDNLFRRTVSLLANLLISIRTGVRLRDYGCALTAAKREVIDNVLSYGSGSRFIKPLMARSADSILEIKVSHRKRASGKSKYGPFKIAKSGIDFLVNFSTKPRKGKPFYIIEKVNSI